MRIKLLDKNYTLFANNEDKSLFRRVLNYMRFRTFDMFSNVEIETSSKCNRKCTYCPNSRYDRGDFLMSEQLFRSIIRQLTALHFEGIIRPHFYNEPLLDKRLPKLLSYAKRQLPQSIIHLYSNGDFLNQSLFEKLLQAGVDKYIITTHGKKMSPYFEEVYHKKRYKKYIYHQYITEQTHLFNRGGTVKVRNGIRLETCHIPSNNLTINYKGQVVLCCNDPLSQNILGDIKKEKIIDIWKKKSFVDLRAKIRKGDYTLDVCKKCFGIS